MPLYLVTVSRIVRDVVEGSIEIAAPDAATAEAMALDFWHEGHLDLHYKEPAWWEDEPGGEPEATAREVTPAEDPAP
jgi:hypothetical protein